MPVYYVSESRRREEGERGRRGSNKERGNAADKGREEEWRKRGRKEEGVEINGVSETTAGSD